MNDIARAVTRVFVGAIFGFAIFFLTAVGLIGYAYTSEQAAILPGIFRAWTTSENGAPAVSFEPNFIGIFIAVAAIALINAVPATTLSKVIKRTPVGADYKA